MTTLDNICRLAILNYEDEKKKRWINAWGYVENEEEQFLCVGLFFTLASDIFQWIIVSLLWFSNENWVLISYPVYDQYYIAC